MAKGYNALGDILKTTVDGQDLNQIWEEHQATLAIQNSARTSLGSLFTFDTVLAHELVAQSLGGSEFEEASEYGVPTGLRLSPETVKVGYTFKWYDLATRFTWRFLSEASAAQVATVHSAALAADNRLVFGKIMDRVFSPTTGANDDGTPVYGFWNGTDGRPPESPAGDTFPADHTHYLTSGGTAITSENVDDLVETVEEHGFGLRQNGDRVLVLANPKEADVIAGFRVADGAKYDAIPAADAPAWITAETIQGERPPANVNGLAVKCSYGDAWVVSDRQIPAGYVIALATGGPGSERNPLGFRQHPTENLRGLVEIPGATPDYPLIDSYYVRSFGVGIRQRGAGAVLQVTASEDYTAP